MEQKPVSVNELYQILGEIKACVTSLEKGITRITYALIGVIAAQIGVKVLGTPPLLDIATTFGILGSVLLLGVLILSIRRIRYKTEKITHTGIALIIMISFITVTQVMVYFRDMGIISVSFIYAIRIVQNLGIIYFAWRMAINHDLFRDNRLPDCNSKTHGE